MGKAKSNEVSEETKKLQGIWDQAKVLMRNNDLSWDEREALIWDGGLHLSKKPDRELALDSKLARLNVRLDLDWSSDSTRKEDDVKSWFGALAIYCVNTKIKL